MWILDSNIDGDDNDMSCKHEKQIHMISTTRPAAYGYLMQPSARSSQVRDYQMCFKMAIKRCLGQTFFFSLTLLKRLEGHRLLICKKKEKLGRALLNTNRNFFSFEKDHLSKVRHRKP